MTFNHWTTNKYYMTLMTFFHRGRTLTAEIRFLSFSILSILLRHSVIPSVTFPLLLVSEINKKIKSMKFNTLNNIN